ncbi:MAG: zinc-dependent metalloprotease [Planctomycetes bacterium]|nr:zinc-dependent metalloprotease [Planctomycetota bacterium]
MRCLVLAFLTLSTALAQDPAATATAKPSEQAKGDPAIAAFTDGMRHLPGFVGLYVDERQAKVYLHLTAFDEDLLYATAQASGLGSNPIGLDRGSLGPQHVVRFRRAGPKVLVMAQNLRFRALSDNERERLAVAESFAPSVLAALPVVARDDDALLVDATGFFVRDATGAGRRLSGDGSTYKVDGDRSTLWMERTRAFPDNTEVEVLLTFAANKARGEVATAAAGGDAVTLRQHHSFVRLPDDGYRPRRFDPRIGYFGPRFQDYAAPLGESMHRHWIARHRLQKRDPEQAVSEPVEPIVYHIDPGTPEPVRSALEEGAMWWAEAFEAAGFRDAFRVEMLPEGADPMDVRYNMIHWVHRRTRGWSYGASISDPRTGEILKGNVLLGSLRVRQDLLKFVGLQAPFDDAACAAAASPGAGHLTFGDDELAQKVALMRIRQLAAHEVGHTLGLSHNFAASTYGRASVMDYPAPLVGVQGDELDFSDAYEVGIGDYDKWAIVYGYMQFPDGADEEQELERVVRAGLRKGYVFLTDQDARAPGTAQPMASLWDNGRDPVAQLEHELRVRAIGLRRFGVAALRPGATLATLEDTLVPLYLHHRYQLEAAAKVIGGVDFRHAVKGDGQDATGPVFEDAQRRALAVLLGTLKPTFLRLDPRLVAKIPPAPPGHPSTAERFPRSTGQVLDPVAMATVCAELTIDALLQPQRAARLELRGDGRGLTFDDVLTGVEDALFGEPQGVLDWPVVQRAAQNVYVDRLIALADDARAAAGVRALAEQRLEDLAGRANGWRSLGGLPPEQRAHVAAMWRRMHAFLERRDRAPRRTPRLEAPPGSPIGG